MAKNLGAITWKEPLVQKEAEKGSIADFKKFCLTLYPEKDTTPVNQDIKNFSEATQTIFGQFEKFSERVSPIPLLTVILAWAESLSKNTFYLPDNIAMMK